MGAEATWVALTTMQHHKPVQALVIECRTMGTSLPARPNKSLRRLGAGEIEQDVNFGGDGSIVHGA